MSSGKSFEAKIITDALSDLAKRPVIIGKPERRRESSFDKTGIPSEQILRASEYILSYNYNGFKAMLEEWKERKHLPVRIEDILEAHNKKIYRSIVTAFVKCVENGDVKEFKHLEGFLSGKWSATRPSAGSIRLIDRSAWEKDVSKQAVSRLNELLVQNNNSFTRALNASYEMDLITEDVLNRFRQHKTKLDSKRNDLRKSPELKVSEALRGDENYGELSMETFGLPSNQVNAAAKALTKAKFHSVWWRLFRKDRNQERFEKLLENWEIGDHNLKKSDILSANNSAIYRACLEVLDEGLKISVNTKKAFAQRMKYLNSKSVDYLGLTILRNKEARKDVSELISSKLESDEYNSSEYNDYYSDLVTIGKKWKLFNKKEILNYHLKRKRADSNYHMGFGLELRMMGKRFFQNLENWVLKTADALLSLEDKKKK